jgi:N-acyl-D-amino-acid deacylase
MAADLVCLDPQGVQDLATYEEPRRHPAGIPHVIVNGRVVIDDGRHTGATPGRALRRGDGRRR